MRTRDDPDEGPNESGSAMTMPERPSAAPGTVAHTSAAVVLDADQYRRLLADEGLSSDQEREYIETAWAILLQAMLLGIRLEFDAESCGQDAGTGLPPPMANEGLVELNDCDLRMKFSNAVGRAGPAAAVRSR
ncbi:MAG: hypothetical protein GC191_13075 [Azospirillum sp.]|nr:hypothetical protein [Azospirillum sp.]